MGKHSGERDTQDRGSARKRVALLCAGTTATLVAWGYLVWAAIDFGGNARAGESTAWIFVLLATLGATACLFMTLILGAKLLAVLRGEPVEADLTNTAIPPGGRRAKR